MKERILAFVLAIVLSGHLYLIAEADRVAVKLGDQTGNFGWSLADVGDLDGDGIADLVVGAPGISNNTGAAYLFFGSSSFNQTAIASSADVMILGGTLNGRFGTAVAGVGDINGDSLGDFAVSAPSSTLGGALYVYHGRARNDWPAVLDTTDANLTILVRDSKSFGLSLAGGSDVNGDARPDVAVAEPLFNSGSQKENGRVWVLHGGPGLLDGLNPVWSTQPNWDTMDLGGSTSASIGDLNRDGVADMIVGLAGGVSYGLRNKGGPSSPLWVQEPLWDAPDVGTDASPALADFDGDGNLDLMVGSAAGALTAYENVGNASGPSWLARPAWDAPNAGMESTPVFADLDTDGDLDLVVGNATHCCVVYRNDGNSSSPLWTQWPEWSPGLAGSLAAPATTDIDMDGDLDLFVGFSNGTVVALRNAGNLTGPIWFPMPKWDFVAPATNVKPAFYDIDNDGDPDMYLGAKMGFILSVANTQSDFQTIIGRHSGDRLSEAVAFGDLNNDTYADLVAGAPGALNGSGQVWVFRGSSSGLANFGSTWFRKSACDTPSVGRYAAPDFTDLDNDGDIDLLIGSSTGVSFAFENTGNSTAPIWTRNPSWDLDTGSVTDAAPGLGDLNGDLLVDAIVGTSQGKVWGFRNSGSTSAPQWIREPAWDLPDVGGWAVPDLYDVDSDGDSDLMVGEGNGPMFAYENMGNASSPVWVRNPIWEFDTRWYSSSYSDASPRIGDLDIDGDADIITGSSSGDTITLENVGNVTNPVYRFNGGWSRPLIMGTYSVPAVADIDADGSPELIVGETDGVGYAFDSLMNVTRIDGSSGEAFGSAVASNGDVNGDGIEDMAIGSPNYRTGDGKVSIFFGRSSIPVLLQASLSDVTINGPGFLSHFGSSLSISGDYEGSRSSDIAVGANASSENGLGSGSTYLFRGEDIAAGTHNVSLSAYSFFGTASGDAFGRAVALTKPLGLRGYGMSHLAVSSPYSNDAAPEGGKVEFYAAQEKHIQFMPMNTRQTAGTQVAFTLGVYNEINTQSTLSDLAIISLRSDSPTGRFRSHNTSSPDMTSMIFPAGLFSIQVDYFDTTVGNWTVVAANASLGQASARVNVTSATLGILQISPYPSAVLSAGQMLSLSALPIDSYGNIVANATIEWNASGVGNVVNASGSNTEFRSVIAGTAVVTARAIQGALQFSNSSIVNVVAAAADHLTIVPPIATLHPGENATFTASVRDRFENIVQGFAFNWTIEPRIGSLNVTSGSNVVMTAGSTVTSGYINVTAAGLNSSAWVNVIAFPTPWVNIVSPLDNDHLTGNISISYDMNPGVTAVLFDYFDGTSWSYLGSDPSIDGQFSWNSSGIDGIGTRLRATVQNSFGMSGSDEAINLEIDNTAPQVDIIQPSSMIEVRGAVQINYTTSADTQSVEFGYFDRGWVTFGIDTTIDGAYTWFTGSLELYGSILRALARDEVGLVGTDDVMGISVNPKSPSSQGPRIEGLPDVVVHFDVSYSLDIGPYVSDSDTPPEDLAVWTSIPAYIWTSPSNNLGLVFNFPQSKLGLVVEAIVWISDGTSQDFDFINVTVSTDYPPEILRPLPDVSFDEDELAVNVFYTNLDYYFLDVDDNNIYYTTGNVSIRVRINANLTVDMWASGNWSGHEVITFRATDPTGALVETKVTVVVRPVNDPPTISTLPDSIVRPGGFYSMDLVAFINDIDNQLGDLIVTEDGQYARVDGKVLILCYPDTVKEDMIMITVSDGEFTTTTRLKVTVLIETDQSGGWYWWFVPVSPLLIAIFYLWRRKKPILAAYLFDDSGNLLVLPFKFHDSSVTPEAIKKSIGRQNMGNAPTLRIGKNRVLFIHAGSKHLAIVCRPESVVMARVEGEKLLSTLKEN